MHKIPLLGRLFYDLGFSSPSRFAMACMGVLLIIYVTKTVYLIFEYNLQAKFISQCKLETQNRLVRIFLNKPYAYYLNKNSADMHKLLVSDLNKVFQVLQHVLTMVAEFVVSVILLLTLFIIDPLMSICVMLIILLQWLSWAGL